MGTTLGAPLRLNSGCLLPIRIGYGFLFSSFFYSLRMGFKIIFSIEVNVESYFQYRLCMALRMIFNIVSSIKSMT